MPDDDCRCITHPGIAHDEHMWQLDYRSATEKAETTLAAVRPLIDRANSGEGITHTELHHLRWAAHTLNWLIHDLAVRHPGRSFKFPKLSVPSSWILSAPQDGQLSLLQEAIDHG